jgi:RHS repeat-associated protein
LAVGWVCAGGRRLQAAALNPFRFSTKLTDPTTDLVLYEYRAYSASSGRCLSRDPVDTKGGLNIYALVANNPTEYVDPDGRAPKKVSCAGVCGAIIDEWILDEIKALKAGWDKWKQQNPGRNKIGDYISWANGNMRYKDPDFFQFNKGTSCGTKDKGAEVGCGRSVTLCGKCVRSAILGNIMYGLVGHYAGFSDQELKTISDWKRRVGAPVDEYDEQAYELGAALDGATDFCARVNELVRKNPSVLYEGRGDGNYNDLSTCRRCTEKTTEKRHGGHERPRWLP